jgi:hypothetical protein
MSEANEFNGTFSRAQVAFDSGDFVSAKKLFTVAVVQAPDTLRTARSIRKAAESTGKLGVYDEALLMASAADNIIRKLIAQYVPGSEDLFSIQRESIQSIVVLGSLSLGQGLRTDLLHHPTANPSGIAAIRHFARAKPDLGEIDEGFNPILDKSEEIELIAKQAIALALFGGPGASESARELALRSVTLGSKSRTRAIGQGIIAVRVSHLATPDHSPHRSKAVRVAQRVV